MPKSTTSAGKTANDFPNGTAMTNGSEVDTSGVHSRLFSVSMTSKLEYMR